MPAATRVTATTSCNFLPKLALKIDPVSRMLWRLWSFLKRETFNFVLLRLCLLHHCHFLIITQSVIKMRDILSLEKMSDVIRCLSSRGSQQAVQHWLSFPNIYSERRQYWYCGSWQQQGVNHFFSPVQIMRMLFLVLYSEQSLSFPPISHTGSWGF